MGLRFGCLPAIEGLLAAEISIIRKEHHGSSLEIRQCSPILSNVDFLELPVRHLEFEQESVDGRAITSSHLLSKQPGARLHCLHCLHEVDKDIFQLTLNPRYVEIMAQFKCSFLCLYLRRHSPGAG